METLNLVEILKDCPKDTKLYCTLFGDLLLKEVNPDNENFPICTMKVNRINTKPAFTKEGYYYLNEDGECVLFPSKECRDWSQFKQPQQEFESGDHVLYNDINDSRKLFVGIFNKYKDSEKASVHIITPETDWIVNVKDLTKVEKFDPKWLKPGDVVLVRDNCNDEWCYSHFSHIKEDCFIASCTWWNNCIPYNSETEHLVGTKDDAPEFYQ